MLCKLASSEMGLLLEAPPEMPTFCQYRGDKEGYNEAMDSWRLKMCDVKSWNREQLDLNLMEA